MQYHLHIFKKIFSLFWLFVSSEAKQIYNIKILSRHNGSFVGPLWVVIARTVQVQLHLRQVVPNRRLPQLNKKSESKRFFLCITFLVI